MGTEAHSSDGRLASLAAGGPERSAAGHLEDGCPSCEQTVEVYRAVARTLRSAVEPAPPEVLSRALRLAPEPPPVRHPGVPTRTAGGPELDSAARPVPEGIRAGGVIERQLLYTVSDFDVDIRLRPGGKGRGLSLTGQVLPADGSFIGSERLQIWLEAPPGEVTSLPVTERGEFRAGDIREGEQTLEVVVDSQVCYRLSFIV